MSGKGDFAHFAALPHVKTVKRIALTLLAAVPVAASCFELALSQPEFHLSVPGLPAAELHEDTHPSVVPKRVLTGAVGKLDIELELSAQASQASPRTCAGSLLRALVAKPGMPNRDSIYRAPLDESTFLVIYALGEGPTQRLHAHVISSAGPTHCANAHFVRPALPGEDIDDWRTTFTSARVVPR